MGDEVGGGRREVMCDTYWGEGRACRVLVGETLRKDTAWKT